MKTYSEPRLRDYGPHEFRRAVQRLMIQTEFEAFSVDGPGDGGGDLYCERNGEKWVIQTKWKKRGGVGTGAIDEVLEARSVYNTHQAIVATNAYFSRNAQKKVETLKSAGVVIGLWDGEAILDFSKQAPQTRDKLSLRDYQLDSVEAASRDLKENGKALLYLATGLGKTVVAGAVIRSLLEDKPDARVLVIAHMRDLIEQLQRALWVDVPLNVSTQLVDSKNQPESLPGVTIATNLSVEKYIGAGYRPDLVVVDECHHVGEDNTYAHLISSMSGIPILGVTATPWRGDQFSIDSVFGNPSYVCGIEDGMKKGYLSPVDYKLFCDNIDWDEVPLLSRHSYTVKDLNRKLFVPIRDEKILDSLSDTWLHVPNPKCIMFCQSITHAESIHKKIVKYERWKSSELLHSELSSNERKFALLRFRSADCPILIAVDILNEGIDVPNVNIVCFARVTHSRKIFVQQLGRGLRLAPGKEKVVVLDFAADIRRLAALSGLDNYLHEGAEVENLDIDRTSIEFSDKNIQSLINEWIMDAADLETSSQETRLQFPML